MSTPASTSLNFSLKGISVPSRLKHAPLGKAAIGVSQDELVAKETTVDYVKGVKGNKVASVVDKSEQELVIPLAANPWEKPQSKATADASKDGKQKPKSETDEQRLNREAAEALLKDVQGQGSDEEDDNSFVIAMNDQAADSKRELSQLERVMAHKKAFEKDEQTGKVLTEKEKLQKEMAMRPEANDFTSETYEKVSIEKFGRAMLLGMGWTPPTKGSEVKAYEAQARPIRLGLGASSKPWEKKRNDDASRRIKPGQKRHKVSQTAAQARL